MDRIPRGRTLLPLAGLLALICFAFRGAVFGGGVFFRRDVHMIWYGQVASFVHAVTGGSWPVWDPFSGFGRPLWANPNNELLYPITWLNLVILPWTYYTLFVVGHFLLASAGMFLLGRRLGVSPFAAFAAAAVWVLSGPFFSLPLAWNHLAGAAWLPWALLGADRALGGERRFCLLWGGALACQILAGSPATCLMGVIVTGLWAVGRLRSKPRAGWLGGWLLPVLLSAAFAVTLSAGQWMPSLELAFDSARAGLPASAQTSWSLHPAALLEVPFAFQWRRLPLGPRLLSDILGNKEAWLPSIYLGLPGAALAVAGLLLPRGRFFGILALAAAAFACGPATPVYRTVSLVVPGLTWLRFPVKAMILAGFCWSLMVGFGIEALRQPGSRVAGRRLLPVILLAGLVLLAWSGVALAALDARRLASWLLPRTSLLEPGRLFAPAARKLALGAAWGTGALALLLWRRSLRAGPVDGVAAVLLLCLADLLIAQRDLHPLAPKSLYLTRPRVLADLTTGPYGRVWVQDFSMQVGGERHPPESNPYVVARRPVGWPPAVGPHLAAQAYLNPPTAGRWGVFGSFDGDVVDLDPDPVARLVRLLREVEGTPWQLRLLRMGAVTNVLALQPRPDWEGLRLRASEPGFFREPIRVFDVPNPLPRTYAVGRAIRVADAQAVAELQDPGFDVEHEVLLTPDAPMPSGGGPFSGRSWITALRADRVSLGAALSRAGWVVLVDAYGRGWKASVDDQPVRVLRANLAFRAIQVPAGRHVIEMRYWPPGLTPGLALSLVAALAAAAWLLRSRLAREGS